MVSSQDTSEADLPIGAALPADSAGRNPTLQC